MKILVIAHDSRVTGGANRSLFMILKGLKNKYNAEIEVLVPYRKGKLNEELESIGIKWHYFFPYFGVISSIRKDGKDILRILKVYCGYVIEILLSVIAARKFKNSNFDIVYTNTRMPIVGAKIAKKIKIPHVCHVREFGAAITLWGFWGYKQLYKQCDKIICISNALHKKFDSEVKDKENKVITIHNGIESPMGLKYNLNKNKDTFDLILVGRIVPDKGHEDAIKAMKILVEKRL